MSHLNQYDQPVGTALPDWQPCPHPERVNLQGRFCRLEPLRSTHAGALFDAHRLAPDTRSWTWLLREPDSSVEEYRAWIESVSGQNDPHSLRGDR